VSRDKAENLTMAIINNDNEKGERIDRWLMVDE
jgi:hypothetical protein